MTPEQIDMRVKEIISEQLEVSMEQLHPGALFRADLKADSLAVVELILVLEQEFGVNIPDEDAEKIRTIKDASEYIKSRAQRE